MTGPASPEGPDTYAYVPEHGSGWRRDAAGEWREVGVASPEGPDEGLREALAGRLAAAGGDGAFDHEDDPERWAADSEDRDYWRSLADAALPLLTAERERAEHLLAAYVLPAMKVWGKYMGFQLELRGERDEARERADALQRQVDAVRALCDEWSTGFPDESRAAVVLRAALSDAEATR